MKNFTLVINEGIATITFDLPKSSVNILSQVVLEELDVLLDELKQNTDIKIAHFVSAKPNIFIAGADISEIRSLDDEQVSYELVRKGQIILEKIEHLPFPTIAVINGACLGGGFELALRCTYRIATENKATKIGLPEVNLGVLPGFGGTQKLKCLIGPAKAIELILGAKMINGAKALKLGMVDACVPQGYLDFKVESFTQQVLDPRRRATILKKRHKLGFLERFLPSIIYKVAYKTVMQKTKGKYPAPLAIIALFKKTQGMSIGPALEVEARAFSKLCITPESKNLISVYYAIEAVKNEKPLVEKSELHPIKFTSVIGGGTMGGGIVWLFAKMGLLVRLKVRGFEQAAKTMQSVAQSFNILKKRRRLNAREVDAKMTRISYGIDYDSLRHSDLALEAIIEDIDAKKEAYDELEAVMNEKAIIASNTSSLSITMLSNHLKHPERFIGMHFFNPVPLMPLVEVIPSDKTSEHVISTVVAMAKKAGKTPIVVKDGAGFLVNRILLPYINECAKILDEGGDIKSIDKIIENFGMPMGPFTLADTVGLDVGFKVAKILEESYGKRMAVSPLLNSAYNDLHLLGKKGKRGFYIHDGKTKEVNADVTKLKSGNTRFEPQEVIDRAMLIMVNEAARCLDEGVVKNAQHLDVAMIFGTGFPPFLGGLLKYADSYGIDNVLHTLERLQDKYGERFEPSPLIVKLYKEKSLFYKGLK